MRIRNEDIQKKINHLKDILNCEIYKKENLLIIDNVILNFKNKTELNNFSYNIIKLHKNNIISGGVNAK